MCILIKSTWGVISDSDQFFFSNKERKKDLQCRSTLLNVTNDIVFYTEIQTQQ